MYKIRVHESFSSAHCLNGYSGACSSVHGHNWKVEIELAYETIDSIGISVDFKVAKNMLKECTDTLDHKMLNELDSFKNINPTAEVISKYIFETLKPKVAETNGKILRVIVWENTNSRMEYCE